MTPDDPHGALEIHQESSGVWSYRCPGCWERHVWKPLDLRRNSLCDRAVADYEEHGAADARRHWLEERYGPARSVEDLIRE